MISKIGYKRTMTLLALAGTLAVLAASSYLLFRPQTKSLQAELQTTKSEVETKQSEVDKMQMDFDLYQKEKSLYEQLEKSGFFSAQNRVVAREKFNTIQKLSKVISTQYQIQSATIRVDKTPPESDFVLMESPVTLSLTAVDDLDIYRFIYYLNYGFSGHITIDSVEMMRDKKVDLEVLKQIGTGDPQPLVTATMALRWRTMAKKDSIAPEDLGLDPNAPEEGQ